MRCFPFFLLPSVIQPSLFSSRKGGVVSGGKSRRCGEGLCGCGSVGAVSKSCFVFWVKFVLSAGVIANAEIHQSLNEWQCISRLQWCVLLSLGGVRVYMAAIAGV